ncbi:MAG: hypothetical protein CMJ53_07805, partial [Planctomycetaceae bacterium]|nr:hypothetical protein [Planctomycetaceae bacterium]
MNMPKNRTPLVAASTLLVALTSNALAQDAVQWRVEDGGNGHWYELVRPEGGLLWENARQAAVEAGGYLVAINTQAENDFIQQLAGNEFGLPDDDPSYVTNIGLFRETADSVWQWVDGSGPATFLDWACDEPNLGTEIHGIYLNKDCKDIGWKWADTPLMDINDAYIVEWSADCNDDGIVDYGQILDGTLTDFNGDFIPDICVADGPVNLVINGSFEDGFPGPTPGGNCGVRTLSGGSTTIPGWIVTGGSFSIDWIDGETCNTTVPDGRYLLDLQGSLCTSCNNNGGVIQTVALPGPGTYVLQLEIKTNSDPNESAVVAIDGIEYEIIGESTKEEWNTYSIPFEAQSSSTELHIFSPQSNTGAGQPNLDNVILVADCNGDGISDYAQIIDGSLEDLNGDGVPDLCEDLIVVDQGESIQDAIDSAPAGSTIQIAAGTFAPDSQLLVGEKVLTIRGSTDLDGNPTTILDGQDSTRLLLGSGLSNGPIVLENLVFERGNNTGVGGGAVLIRDAADLAFLNCTFRNNHADEDGGAVSIREEPFSTAAFTNCRFLDNSAGDDGGAVQSLGGLAMVDCTFDSNFAASTNGNYDGGGAIRGARGEMSFDGCTFTGNATNGFHGGGAILATEPDSVVVTSCLFDSNEALGTGSGQSGSGGVGAAICLRLTGVAEVSDSSFINNTARGDGAVYLRDEIISTWTNCDFEGNSATWDTGAFGMTSSDDGVGCTTTLRACRFTGNFTTNGNSQSSVLFNGPNEETLIELCRFTENGEPGAVIVNPGGTLLTIASTLFCSNFGADIDSEYTDGGGNCFSSSCSDLDQDGILDQCDPCPTWPGTCSEDGDTLFVSSDDGAEAIQLALTAVPEGGTVRVGPGTYVMTEPIDFDGKAVVLEADSDPAAGLDGEVILDGTGLQGSIVLAISGEGPDTVLRGFVLQNGTTGSDPIAPSSWDYTVAGALYVHASSPTIENCVFRNCSAESAGAAFFFASESLISGCSFTDNVSDRNGGGLQLHTSEANIEDCVFTGNQASALGGAVHNWKGAPSFIRCTITDNTALTAGGGMSFFWNTTAEGNAIVEDCVITRNVAQVEGGGLMLTTETELTLDWLLVGSTTICNNTPENT